MDSKDTIAAIATAPGNAGIAIIRISGSKSLSVLKKIFKPITAKKSGFKTFQTHKFYYGKILDTGRGAIDETLVVYFKKPKTYTREDVVEIHCHGGFITARKILDRILKEDIKIAKPGEFTERAFLNGRIDLTQAEAIADIIYAKSDKAQEIAERQLTGEFQKKIKKILRAVLEIRSHVLTNIDFPDEDIPDISKKDVVEKIAAPITEIESFLLGNQLGTIYKEGLRAVLVGLPNVGKSSILNRLVKDARAIVTDVPGTTRDILEDQIEIGGLLLRIFDTAGVTDTEDKVEKEGVRRSFEAIKKADLVLLVIEKPKDVDNFFSHLKSSVKKEFRDKKIFIVRNKIDLGKKTEKFQEEQLEKLNIAGAYEVSAKTGEGIRQVEKALFSDLQKLGEEGSVFITSLRQRKLLGDALKALKKTSKLAEAKENEDKILVELSSADDALREIIGETIEKNILKKVFSKFCVGK